MPDLEFLDLAGGIKLLEKLLPICHPLTITLDAHISRVSAEPDKGMALVHFQAAADRGNSISQLLVADFYAYGVSGPVKVDLAFAMPGLPLKLNGKRLKSK